MGTEFSVAAVIMAFLCGMAFGMSLARGQQWMRLDGTGKSAICSSQARAIKYPELCSG